MLPTILQKLSVPSWFRCIFGFDITSIVEITLAYNSRPKEVDDGRSNNLAFSVHCGGPRDNASKILVSCGLWALRKSKTVKGNEVSGINS